MQRTANIRGCLEELELQASLKMREGIAIQFSVSICKFLLIFLAKASCKLNEHYSGFTAVCSGYHAVRLMPLDAF